ncbi:hypothetical protein RvY_01345-2 [Ramazzottius varieornatus]|uniref:ENPP1-3/EXOG-like endonuclease/phosphodiesterase domain-containing protein n=1 Tax=Ramazzottius varieornatus TaxID=947166 RepID=A0A1D1UM33_RAMVA|nr:hypothetical protein RvY_01345-2 [Ramazzottius varieornatus]
MESFQLLNTEEEEDMELTPISLDRPAVNGHGTKIRRSDRDRGSVESLNFSFENGNSAFATPASKKAAWIHRTRRYFAVTAACALCFLIGFLIRRNTPNSADSDNPQCSFGSKSSRIWTDQIAFTPDFARCPRSYADRPPLLVVSFDGFRADLLQNTHALRMVAEHGLRAPHMRPVYPSNTFPNHYSIVTGLYPESHGIIDNTFSNADFSKTFATYLKSRFEPEWWKGRPIWEIAKKQGRKVFAHFWPGSEAIINGVQPDHWVKFTLNETVQSRVKTLIDFLTLERESRPDLILSYYPEPDWTAHNKGLYSAEFAKAIASVNEFVGSLMQGLAENRLMDCVDVIFLSDHGLADYSYTTYPTGVLKDKLTASELTKINIFDGLGSHNRIAPLPGGAAVDKIAETLQCTDRSSPYRVYTNRTIPRRYHHTNSDRIAPILLTANITHALHSESHKNYSRVYAFHGWDPVFFEMRAIFIAYGPSFRTNVTVEPFQNVELYNLFAEMLDIQAVGNNGTDGSLLHLLRHSTNRPRPSPTSLANFTVAGSITGAVVPLCGASSTCQQIPAQVTDNEREDMVGLHVGNFGIPIVADKDSKTVLLVDKHWTTSFSEQRGIPLWVAFRLKSSKSGSASLSSPAVRSWGDQTDNCQHEDPRVVPSSQPLCRHTVGTTTVIPTYLFPEELASGIYESKAVTLSSGVVPMYEPFRNGVWKRFWEMVVSWDIPERHMRVLTGTVFDFVPPFGIADDVVLQRRTSGSLQDFQALPSHFYVILTRKRLEPRCEAISCHFDVISFVFPHQPEADPPCQVSVHLFLSSRPRSTFLCSLMKLSS